MNKQDYIAPHNLITLNESILYLIFTYEELPRGIIKSDVWSFLVSIYLIYDQLRLNKHTFNQKTTKYYDSYTK